MAPKPSSKNSTYPPRLAEELARLESVGGGVEDTLNILVATLMYLDFDVEGFGERKIDQWQGARGCGPFVWLWSIDFRKWYSEYSDLEAAPSPHDTDEHRQSLEKRMTIANLRDRARLLDFLGEFYRNRSASADIRLVISDLALGSSILKSQGSDVMALPENEPNRAKWLKQARAEMADFSAFLVARLGEQDGKPAKG